MRDAIAPASIATCRSYGSGRWTCTVRENVFVDRIVSTLSAAFAMLATLLASVGLYGVLSYTVSQRTREFGLRMALGAAPGRVRQHVLRQVMWMVGIGAVVGLGLWRSALASFSRRCCSRPRLRRMDRRSAVAATASSPSVPA